MSIEVTINEKELVKALLKRGRKFTKQVEKKFNGVSEDYIAHIVKTYYTGRKSDDTGLYVGHGTGAGSWFTESVKSADYIASQIKTTASYLKRHEYGYGRLKGKKAKAPQKTKLTFKQKSKLPSNFSVPIRTFVRRDFRKGYLKNYRNAVSEAIKESF